MAAGIGCLTLSGVLLLRAWGLWFLSDRIVWPLVIAAAGGALIWRQSQAAPEARAQQRAALPRAAVNRVGVGVALVLGAALIFLYLNDLLAPAGDVILPVLVILVAAGIILAPWWLRLVRGLADERAARIRSPGARRGRRAPARQRAADARAGAEAGGRPGGRGGARRGARSASCGRG